jgi:dTDP-4-dehydrorhamnose 3,5-epimerase
MQVLTTSLKDVKIVQPRRFGDDRGWFAEFYNSGGFGAAGLPTRFVQDNQSFSARGVLRGLHYQLGRPQGKLVRCLSGHIWDIAVDLRRDSPDFGKHFGMPLKPIADSGDLQMLWIPEGFAHGFVVLSETAEVLYKTTSGYYPAGERAIRWDDPTLAIPWPIGEMAPLVSPKDAVASSFLEAELPPVA